MAGAWSPSAALLVGRGEDGSAWATLGTGNFRPKLPAPATPAVHGGVARARSLGMLGAAECTR